MPYNAPNADLLKVMSADNPYNPYGSHFFSPTGAPNADGTARLVGTPRPITLLSRLLVDGGADTISVQSDVYRAVAGFRGSIGKTWTWETGALYSWAKSVDETPVGFRESLFGNALARTDATAFNPFGYTFKVANGAVVADQPYANPRSVLDTIMAPQPRTGESSIGSLDFRSSGEVLSIWSGAISLAVGAEYRRETFSDKRPPYFGLNPPGSGLDPDGNDFIQASPKPDSSGTRNVESAYAEVVVPLAAPENNIPFVHSLELSGSVRYENYSDFGETTNPKYSANWRPIDWLMIRASHNEGFTAPNLPTLYFPAQFTVSPAPGTVDPYRNPVTNEGAYVFRNYTGGNRDLKPTESQGASVGTVVDVPQKTSFMDRLTLSADYWEIRQTDLVGSRGGNVVLQNDVLLLQAYTAAQLAAGVPINSIDLGSGTANYKGDPAVIRNPVNPTDIATFAAYNATHPGAQQAVVGTIFGRQTLYQNLSEAFVNGWDFSVDYSAPTLPIGKITASLDATMMVKSYSLLPQLNGPPSYLERMDSKWRGSATVGWRLGGWGASLSAYYVDSFTDSGATTTAAIYNSLGQPDYLLPFSTTERRPIASAFRRRPRSTSPAATNSARKAGWMGSRSASES